MSNPNPSNMLFSSRFKYYLNYDTATGSVSVPSTSYGSGTYKTYTISIPIERNDDYSNIKVNYSHRPNDWFSFPAADLPLGSSFTISTLGQYSGTSFDLTFYIVNQPGSTASNTAITITAKVALFVTPE